MAIQSVKDLERLLKDFSYDVKKIQLDDFHALFEVYLGQDYKDRERVCDLSFKPQIFSTEENSENRYYALIFSLVYPFKVKEFASSDLARFIAYCNYNIEFPGFEVDEFHQKIRFRYTWIGVGESLTPDLIKSYLGMIAFLNDTFSQDLESVASGEKTTQDLLEDMIKNFPNTDQE